MFHHPFGSAFFFKAAVKLESSPNSNHYASFQERLQLAHENLLLGRTQCNPYYVCTIGIHHVGDFLIIKLVNRAEGQLIESHVGNAVVYFHQVLFKGSQRLADVPMKNILYFFILIKSIKI